MIRANNFDAVRLLAAAAVLVGHSMEITGRPTYGLVVSSISTFSVCVFFAISGYLVTISWLRDPHPAGFAGRRARRIMPGLAFVVVTCTFLLGPAVSTLSIPVYLGSYATIRYLGNLVFYTSYALPGTFATNPIPYAVNGSLWTLPVEATMYVVTPLLLGLRPLRPVTIGAAFAAMMTCSLYHFIARPAAFGILGTEFWSATDLVPYYLAGMAVAAFRLEWLLDWRVGLAAVYLLDHEVGRLGQTLSWGLMPIVVPYAALAVGLRRWPIVSRAGRWGDFSYGIYLWAFPMQQTALYLSGNHWTGWANVITAGPATLLAAIVSWHLVEAPALGRRRGQGRPAAERVPLASPADSRA
jgi:peptidoglycan/LPS O-acetylase OafA/YrhL